MQQEMEALYYNYSFIQVINERFKLFGNGAQRLIVPVVPGLEIIAYVIKKGENIPLNWDEVKRNHPRTAMLEERTT